MRKTIIIVILLGITMFGVIGCKKNDELNIGEKSNIDILKKDVLMSLKNKSLTKTGVILILKNDCEKDVQYGNSYEIEKLKDGVWHKIDVKLYFTSPSYELKPNEIKEIDINWENSYGQLPPGQYRIIKSIDIKENNKTFTTFHIATEFEIK